MAADGGGAGNSQIAQLDSARLLALSDPTVYMKFLPAILPILRKEHNPSPELRAWGADFLAEAFSSPTFPAEGKQETGVRALPVIKDLLETGTHEVNQNAMTKSLVQTVASVYPLVFRYVVRNKDDAEPWQLMSAIKSNILRRMDQEHPGVRVVCIRFLERVVQTQTPGIISDPRRPESNETSLALVSPDHPILKPQNLEAEAHGLLDRALGILLENHSDALLVTATLNGLGALLRTRATVANRILNAVLNYNPFRLANSPITPANKLLMKSMEKTVVVFLQHVLKRAPQHPMAPRIEAHILRLQAMRKEVLDGSGLKRPAEEPAVSVDPAKRQKLGIQSSPAPPSAPPLPPGPISVAQLFTLTDNPQALSINIKAIPPDLASGVVVNLLRNHVSKENLEHASNTIRARYQQITQPTAVSTTTALDDEDDYEPDYFPSENAEQVKNRIESDESQLMRQPQAVPVFQLPRPPPLTVDQIDVISRATADRMFDNLARYMATRETPDGRRGFHNSVVRGSMDTNSYFRMIVRIASRPFAGEDDASQQQQAKNGARNPTTFSDYIRHRLLQFILSDWQRRIGFAVTWFTEEYVADNLLSSPSLSSADTNGEVKPYPPSRTGNGAGGNYKRWILHFLKDLSVYLGGGKQDLKFLVRFVSEIPLLDRDILTRVAEYADEPERVATVSAAVRYLVTYRPSVRHMALDALELVWRYEGHLKDSANAKMLKRMRPEAVDGIQSVDRELA